jgi:hypothetical protein
MKRIIRLTEGDLTRIVKRVINESDVIKIDDENYVLGGESLFSGKRPEQKTELDFAKLQLQIVIMLLNALPNKISQKEKIDLKRLYGSYIDIAINTVKNNDMFLEELLPMCERLENLIDKTLNEKSDKQID